MIHKIRIKEEYRPLGLPRGNLTSLLMVIVISLALTVLTSGILASVSPDVWRAMQPSTCLSTQSCFCETLHLDDGIRQPANTVSSFGFLFIGVLIIALSRGLSEAVRLPPLYGSVLGTMTVIVGFGSAFYHTSMTFVGQFFDILGMYLVASFVLLYAFERLYQIAHRNTIVWYVRLNVFLTLIQILIPDLRRYTFAGVLLIGLLLEYAYQRRGPVIRIRWFVLGLMTFALAYGIWILDNSHVLCTPESLLQGHAVWHVMGAGAVLCLFFYYTSEPTASVSI